MVIFATLAYLGYDQYFRLPVTPVAKDKEQMQAADAGNRFNILILGLDGRKGVGGNRTDTIILTSVDPKNEEVRMLSIPRDTRVKIKGSWDKINAAYAYGGLDLAKKTISDFLGVTIDRYAVVNFNSVVKLVDEVGGLDVNVLVKMYVPLEGIDLKPGYQHLNGEQVLAYSRFRYTDDGDIGRAGRQQEVLKLLVAKVLDARNVTKLPQLFNDVKENVNTDLSVKEMISLGRIAPDAVKNGIVSQVLPGKNKKIDGIWYWEADTTFASSLAPKINKPLASK